MSEPEDDIKPCMEMTIEASLFCPINIDFPKKEMYTFYEVKPCLQFLFKVNTDFISFQEKKAADTFMCRRPMVR